MDVITSRLVCLRSDRVRFAAQAQDETFDIVTGVEVIDQNFRTFILEGLADGAILRLLEVR